MTPPRRNIHSSWQSGSSSKLPVSRPLHQSTRSLPDRFEQAASEESIPRSRSGFQHWRNFPTTHHVDTNDTMESEENNETNSIEEWDKLRRWAASCVVTYGAYAASLLSLFCPTNYIDRDIFQLGDYKRRAFLDRLTLEKDEDCHNQLRMGKEAFARLVSILRDSGRLSDTHSSCVEERVAMFLNIIGHNRRNWSVKLDFWRSGETVSRHFHQVLDAIISLEDVFLQQPDGSHCPPEISNSSKFWPYFKDCVGAIDGSHFRVKVPNNVVQRYRGRKDFPTQNVLATCSFDLKFLYVLSGWEGSASDSRILNNALSRDIDRLVVPSGKFYLGDAGFQLKTGFITPYRGTRYHLKEYSIQRPQNARELFNLRHASLRNVIERAFGVLKKRFPILGSGTEPFYPAQTQADMVLAGCILHNYLMGVDPDERLILEVDSEIRILNNQADVAPSSLVEECQEAEQLRDVIASSMWRDSLNS